ncbi:MAG: hypothetical protein NTX49_06025 [Chlamydiae bacterium]|nr:hypothetical protein [Chlamydiota bacterium]
MSSSTVSSSPSLLSHREGFSLSKISHNPDVFFRLSEMLPGGGSELLLVNKKIKKRVLSTFSSFKPEVKLHLMFLAKQPLIERVEVLQEEISEANEDVALASDALLAFRRANQTVIGISERLPCLRSFRCIRGTFQRLEVLSDLDQGSRESLSSLKLEQKKMVIEILGLGSRPLRAYLRVWDERKAMSVLAYYNDAGSSYESIYDIVGGVREFYKLPEYAMSLAVNRGRERAEAAAIRERTGPRPEYYTVERNSWCRNLLSQDMSAPIMRGVDRGRPFILFKASVRESTEGQRALVIFQALGERWGTYALGNLPTQNIRAIWSIEGLADLSFKNLKGRRIRLHDNFPADTFVDFSGNDGVLPFLKDYAASIAKKAGIAS